MEINWRLCPVLKEDDYRQYPDLNPVILQILFNRGIRTAEDIQDFLQPKYPDGLTSPFAFNQMEEAVALIIRHIKAGNLITIYGDYDADGVTSTGLLFGILKLFKAKVDIYIPHRVDEGYGLNRQAIKKIIDKKTKLIITVDSGIRSQDEVELATQSGVEVIVTDHHLPPRDQAKLPGALIVNPNNHGEAYPFKGLAGVGVAFKLAQALVERSKLNSDLRRKIIDSSLDLLAIGTVADCVTLTGENRTLVREGIKRLAKTNRPGLKELMAVSGTDTKNLDAWHIGFQIGPRINAAGRMDHALLAFNLVVAEDEKNAKQLAEGLNRKNQERQAYTDEVMEYILKGLEESTLDDFIVVICPGNEEGFNDRWNEGIMGLVAGKLTNRYYRPSIVFTRNHISLKGSGRSIEGVNIIELLDQEKELLQNYGGHPSACGLRIKEKDFGPLKQNLNRRLKALFKEKSFKPSIQADLELNFEDLSLALAEDLESLRPFGEGNPRPVFVSRQVKVLDIRYLGTEEKHLKLRLKQKNSRVFSAIGFNMVEDFTALSINDEVDLCYNIEINTFNGRTELQIKIIDIKIV